MRLLLLLAIASCVDTGPGPTGKKIDPTYVQAHLLSAVPADIEKFDLQLGDSVIYLGNRVDKPRAVPGQPITITHYWKVLSPPGARWTVFAHLRGPAGTADFMNLPATDMQRGHGPGTWQAGEIIEDIQTFTLRPDWKSSSATLLVGLIEQGAHGPLDRMAIAGPQVGPRTKDRAIVARVLDVDLSRAPPPKGTAYISRAHGPVKIDGLGNELGWAGVLPVELVTAESGRDPVGKALAKMTWDDDHLYVFVNVIDNDITTPYKNHDDPLWKGDCVELFIDADQNRRGYVELQVNPNNATFDSWFATTRGQAGDEKWDAGMVTAVKLRGRTEAGDSGDIGWDVEIAIPWAALKGRDDNMKVRLPPNVGDRMRLNLVRVDRKTGAKPNEVAASSWNRITMADFHALDRMLTVVFADTSGSIVPRAAGTGSGSAAPATGSGSAAGSGAAGSGSAAKAAGSGAAGSGSAAKSGTGSAVRSGAAGSAAQSGAGSAVRSGAAGSAAQGGVGSAVRSGAAGSAGTRGARSTAGSAVKNGPAANSGSAGSAVRPGSATGSGSTAKHP